MTAKLLGIATRSAKRAPMETCSEAELNPDTGVGRDFRGKPGRRQVTVLTREAWEAACAELRENLPWTLRRANLYVEGVNLEESAGKTLVIGEVVMELTGETNPCYRMDEQCPGLMTALEPHWRGGALGRVVSGGIIRVGDPVTLKPASKA